MNLIEQLGGYDKSKWWEHNLIEAEKKGIHHTGSNSALLFTLKELQSFLMEYRRENNIFEVGDYVVMDTYKTEYQFYQISEDDIGSHWINLVEFRHATDQELEAGHRI